MKAPLTQKQIAAVERTLSLGMWAITAGAVLFSVLTVTPLVRRVTPDGWDWTAPILPIVVDAAVVIVIRLDAAVARLGGSGGGWPVALRWLTGLFTVCLNIGDSAWKEDYAGVAVHAVAPLLLIVSAEASLAYRRAIARALDRIAREQAEQVERERRERAEREARERAEREAREQAERREREAREQAERQERERAREQAERREREAREHAERLERERREHEAQLAREQREAEAALRREEAEREERRLERERAERAAREQAEREERERRERQEREAREHAERVERERREREQRERAERERQAREQADREARERAEAAARTRRERQAVNAPVNTRRTPAVNTSRMSEEEARALVLNTPGASVRELADKTGWSIGWVSKVRNEPAEADELAEDQGEPLGVA